MTVTAVPESRRVVEPALATTRRLQGLAAIGWPAEHLAGQMGVSPVTVRRLTAGQDGVTADIAARAEQLYDDLRDTPGPSEATRRMAAEPDHDYAPPAAWHGADIADPRARARATRASLTAVPSPRPASAGPRRSARLPQPAAAEGQQHPLKSVTGGGPLELPCERDPNAWFPDSSDTEAVAAAKAACVPCPVRARCLDFALGTDQKSGVWGGLSEDERTDERRRRRRAS